MLKNQVLTIIRNRQQEHITEDQIMSTITGKPTARAWTEEDHDIYYNISSVLVELIKDGTIKSVNNGFNYYSYKTT